MSTLYTKMNTNFSQNYIYRIKVDALETAKQQSKTPPLPPNNDTKQNSVNQNVPSSSLSGLLSHYNSDSESEDDDNKKLDLKVDNFLQEINEINQKPNIENVKTEKSVEPTTNWQECFDTHSGFPYYWNMVTNEVTWEIPQEYATFLENQKAKVPTEPVFKIVATENPKSQSPPIIVASEDNNTDKNSKKEETQNQNQKIDKKQLTQENLENKNSKKVDTKRRPQTRPPKVRKKSSDSDEGKIELITSYCEDSTDTEPEPENLEKTKPKVTENTEEKIEEKKENSPPPVLGPHIEDIPAEYFPPKEEKREIIETLKENIDETVILARLKTQAKVLEKLGETELSENVENFLNNLDKENSNKDALSLVAGYGQESDDEESTPEKEKPKNILFPISESLEKNDTVFTSESTLFPKQEPIDLNQFQVPNDEKNLINEGLKSNDISNEDQGSVENSKLTKRKKRIAFDVLPTISEKKMKENNSNDKFLGFGFKQSSGETSAIEAALETQKKYINFQKGEIAFIKSESEKMDEGFEKNSEKINQNLKDILSEKVEFLCEAKIEVSPVQTILIQLNTLELAFKAGGLLPSYFNNWLKETNSELANLEKEAAPKGWICQWDRSHKRYFYKNENTGVTQWEYPNDQITVEESQPQIQLSVKNVNNNDNQDIVGGGEEMDICTTPPPEEEKQEISPVTPPPPIITVTTGVDHTKEDFQPPLPPQILEIPPPPPPPCISENQPPPPGVNPSEIVSGKENSFSSELDSFYSDIAQMETTTNSLPLNTNNIEIGTIVPQNLIEISNTETEGSATTEVKKKKKTKSKIGQGLTMKKKNVSKLVEKWKKVQNEFS